MKKNSRNFEKIVALPQRKATHRIYIYDLKTKNKKGKSYYIKGIKIDTLFKIFEKAMIDYADKSYLGVGEDE